MNDTFSPPGTARASTVDFFGAVARGHQQPGRVVLPIGVRVAAGHRRQLPAAAHQHRHGQRQLVGQRPPDPGGQLLRVAHGAAEGHVAALQVRLDLLVPEVGDDPAQVGHRQPGGADVDSA
ncbi:hypothetical protein NKG94_28090 [Micromonospora sp. M12]